MDDFQKSIQEFDAIMSKIELIENETKDTYSEIRNDIQECVEYINNTIGVAMPIFGFDYHDRPLFIYGFMVRS